MLVPSTAVESMGLGGLLGAAAMRQQALSQEPAGSDPSMGRWSDRMAREGQSSAVGELPGSKVVVAHPGPEVAKDFPGEWQ